MKRDYREMLKSDDVWDGGGINVSFVYDLIKEIEKCHSEPNTTSDSFVLMKEADGRWSFIDPTTKRTGFGDTPVEAIINFNELWPWPEEVEAEVTNNPGKMLHMDRWTVTGDDGKGPELAKAHADWLFDLLRKIYIEAFEHGYKHGRKR